MLVRAFLLLLGFCFFVEANDFIPLQEKVRSVSLPNGVKAFIQENANPAHLGSFRVVLRKPSCDEVLYSFEADLSSLDMVENFFMLCCNEAREQLHDPDLFNETCRYSCSDLPSFQMACPREMAVVAVGDFNGEAMLGLIEKYFASVSLARDDGVSEGFSPIHVGFDGMLSKVAMRVSFANLRRPLGSLHDLRDNWKCLILQDLFQQRMERCSRGVEESWVHPHPRFFYPVNGYTLSSEEISENLLSLLLWQVEAVRNEGFSADEFFVVKRKLLNQVRYLAARAAVPDSAFLASYYTDQFLLSGESLSMEAFFNASCKLIEGIEMADISPLVDAFFADAHRTIQVVYPVTLQAKGMTKDHIEEMIERIASLASFYEDSEIAEDSVWIFDTNSKSEENSPSVELANAQGAVTMRLVDNVTDPYYQLPLTDKEQRMIRSIITNMAEKNVIQLALIKHTMEKKGKKITHVHPMRFAGYIFSNPDLKSCMKQVKKSSFKWDAYVDGFSKRMKEEYNRNNVFQHIPGFCQQVGADPAEVKRYIEKKDWEGLLKSLF